MNTMILHLSFYSHFLIHIHIQNKSLSKENVFYIYIENISVFVEYTGALITKKYFTHTHLYNRDECCIYLK